MRKIFLFVFFTMLVLYLSGCNLLHPYRINPPDWIMGTWQKSSTYLWRFTEDDVIFAQDGRALSLRNQTERGDKFAQSGDGSSAYTITNLTTGDEYSFSLESNRIYVTVNGIILGWFTKQ